MHIGSVKLTVTSKGQVTLRRTVLQHLGVSPGDMLEVELLPGGRVEVRAVAKGTLEPFFGMLTREGQPSLTIDEINEIIAAGWAGEL